MKMKKAAAVVLALSMAVSVAGCSKVRSVTSEEVIDACDEMGFDEFEEDDMNGFHESSFEDGFFYRVDSDTLEEATTNITPVLRMSGLDLGIDIDNIDEMLLFGRGEGLDDFDNMEEPGDLDDVETEIFVGAQITLDEFDQDVLDDIADGLDDLLRKAGIDIDDLSSSEYRLNRDSLFLKIHVDFEELAPAFLESEFCDAVLDQAPDDDEADEFVEAVENMTGHGSIAVYVADGNILVIADVAVNCEPAILREFADAVNVDDPSKLPNSDVAVEAIIETLDDYANMFREYTLDSVYSGF